MRLAIIDPHDNVILAWPTTADAHDALGSLFAARVAPRWWQKRKRARLAARMVEHLLELQRETIRL